MIDYLKVLCCLLVIINHYPWTSEQKLHPLFVFIVRMAVPVFMILSGYTFSLSAERRHQSIRQQYSLRSLWPKFTRFTVPVIIAFGIYLLFSRLAGNDLSFSHVTETFLLGDYGPGSYYYGMMLQLLVFFPLLYALLKKTGEAGLCMVFVLHLFFEIGTVVYDIPYEYYRISLYRYFMYIAFGIYLFINRRKKLHVLPLLLSFLAGSFYLISFNYEDVDWPIFKFWSWSALPVAFFIFPFVYLILHYFGQMEISGKPGSLLSFTGKASYHIFLVQMLYYQLEFDTIANNALPTAAALLCHIAVCVSLGIGYYILENHLTSSLSSLYHFMMRCLTLSRRKRELL